LDSLAKNTAAFFRISRSSFSSAFSAREKGDRFIFPTLNSVPGASTYPSGTISSTLEIRDPDMATLSHDAYPFFA
ncbi:hypothetical protein, partial [Pseudomonas sp. VA159-2]